MKKTWTRIAYMGLILLLTLSCSIPLGKSAAQPSAGTPETAPAGAEQISPTTEPVQGADLTPLEPLFTGGVSFEINTANSAGLAADPAADMDQLLSLTTSDGTLWTLTIPPGALDQTAQIRITELTNIASGDLGSLQSGLLLEPDGLRFNRFVRLSAQGSGLGAAPVIFTGSHDGAELDLALTTLENGLLTAYLSHFSNAYADPMTDEQKKQTVDDGGAGIIRDAMRRAAETMTQDPKLHVTPPAFSLACLDNSAETQKTLDKFFVDFTFPEEELISRLSIFDLHGKSDDYRLNYENRKNTAVWQTIRQLLDRLMIRTESLYEGYGAQEDYFLSVSLIAQRTEALVSHYEMMYLDGTQQRTVYAEKRLQWARDLINQFLPLVRDQHDYQYVNALLVLPALVELDEFGKDRPLMDQIDAALTFIIQFDLNTQTNLDSFGALLYTTQGSATYRMIHPSRPMIGAGMYTNFKMPEVEMTSPIAYDFQVVMDDGLDFCGQKKAVLTVNRFSNDAETFASGGMPIVAPGGFSWALAAIAMAAFEGEIVPAPEKLTGEPWYQFTVPLVNKGEIAGSLEIPRELPANRATLKIQIIHSPQ
ncbi:MAG: hypothetical protein AAGU05_04295 [Anaerolineaceae bacterium]